MLRFPRLVWLALIFFIAAAPAQAEDFAAIVAGLAGDSFAVKEKGVTALGKSGEVRAVAILQALGSDRLRKTTDGRVVIVDGAGASAKVSDAATGQPIADIAPDSLDRIIVNNRLRGAIEAALGALTLFSPDRAARLAAAQDALRHPSAQTALLLEKALTAEQDPEIRATMQRSFAASQLFAGSKEERLAAIRALGTATDPQVKNLLDEFRYSANLDPDLYKAAGEALAAIESRLRWTGIAANLFQGISLGSVLLLAAIGLAITFGVMGVINMAHGEMIMTGAYVAFVIQQLFRAFLPPGFLDAYLLVAVPMAFLFAGLLGVLLERCLIRFLYGRPLETLLATWGVSLILQQGLELTFGLGAKPVTPPIEGTFDLFFTVYPAYRLILIGIAMLTLLGVILLISRTSFGLDIRTVIQNREMAEGVGINTRRTYAIAFTFGAAIAGLAGGLVAPLAIVLPQMGVNYLANAFFVVIVGGVGSIGGLVAGSVFVGGLTSVLNYQISPSLAQAIVLLAAIVAVRLRPNGLFNGASR